MTSHSYTSHSASRTERSAYPSCLLLLQARPAHYPLRTTRSGRYSPTRDSILFPSLIPVTPRWMGQRVSTLPGAAGIVQSVTALRERSSISQLHLLFLPSSCPPTCTTRRLFEKPPVLPTPASIYACAPRSNWIFYPPTDRAFVPPPTHGSTPRTQRVTHPRKW